MASISALKLISLNIERSKHVDRAAAFLEREAPDVACLQELMEYDVPRFEEVFGGRCHYTPVTIHDAEGKPGPFGQGIFSRLSTSNFFEKYYWGVPGVLPHFDFTNAATKHATETHAVSGIEVEKEGATFRIATTHFTWTPDGSASDFQRADLKRMFAVLDEVGECVLVGDFNAPRGGEIFSKIAARYKDNIPLHYKTSIDATLHRVGALPHMVDGLFTTPAYKANEVKLVDGISDHMAIVALITRSDFV